MIDPEEDLEALGRAALERARRDVRAFGWHAVMVSGGGDPGFLFTIGLWQSYGHPEILLFAPAEDPRGMAGRLQAVAERIQANETFEGETLYEGLFGEAPGRFHPVAQGWYPFFLGTALAFYESYDFPVLQLFWPDQDGCFPWETGFAPLLFPFQPLLHETTTNVANLPPGVAAALAGSGQLDTVSLSSEDLFVELDEETSGALLEDWRWLVGDDAEVFQVTVFGDLFLIAGDGHVHLLNTGWGIVEEVAEDQDRWAEEAAIHGPQWFHVPVFLELRSLGMLPSADQVYGWRHPLFLGGAETADNVELISAPVHISHLGRLAESTKDLPPGTPVSGFNFDPA